MNLETLLKVALLQSHPELNVVEIHKINQGLRNFNFLLIDSSGKKKFAKVFRNSNHRKVKREAALNAYLNEVGIPSPAIYQASLCSDDSFVNHMPFILYDHLEGHHAKALIEDAAEIGRLIASLHVLPVFHDLQPGDQHLARLATQLDAIIPDIRSFEKALLLEAMQSCRGLLHCEARQGIVHADVFLDNCIKGRDGRMYLLDFENACFDYQLRDLGSAMLGCCSKDGLIDFELVRHFLDGYLCIRKLTEIEWHALYDWLIFAILSTIIWRYIAFNIDRPTENRQQLYQAFMPTLEQILTLDKTYFLCMLQPQQLVYAR